MSPTRLLLRQVGLEQRGFWRNPQAAFFSFALPIGLLLIFGALAGDDRMPARDDLRVVTMFVPGILVFGVIVTTYANLAATIATLRADGVLKRIRATPLPSGLYLAGQLANALATALLIALATVLLGWVAFGSRPEGRDALTFVGILCVGILCFAALGLAISAVIPTADAAGPITNGTYLPLALVSGVFTAEQTTPSWLTRIVDMFPVKALVDGLRAGYDPAAHGVLAADFVVLAVWTVVGVALAHRYFRWEP